jgi:hypothetical protein
MKFNCLNGGCRRWSVLLLAGAACLVQGCGSGYPTTVSIQGTITYRGKPINKGEVQFSPKEDATGKPRRLAVGEVDAQGNYSLSTFTKGDGILPGEYVVTITLPKRKSGVEVVEGAAATEQFVPAIYSELDKTPLKATIPADASGALRFDFDLKDQ